MTRQRADRIGGRMLAVAMALLLVAAALTYIKVPYVVESPGPATSILAEHDGASVITVKGHQTYPTTGDLYFTTVRVLGGPERHITLAEYLRARLDSDVKLLPEEAVFGTGMSEQQVEQLNTAEMQSSQKDAIAVALRSAGETVPQRNVVAEIAKGLPADGRLRLKDEVVSVDGHPVKDVRDIVRAISGRDPGEKVRLGIIRSGTRTEVTLTTTDLDSSAEGKVAGVGIGIEPLFDYPYEVRIDAGKVGGPSAGMMFALAVYDLVTPGALTGGQHIAGTGTIDDQGDVGPIGGIQQKLIGAKESGARYFLAPADNCDEVRGHVPDGLTVVKVGRFTDARTAVERIGEKKAQGLPSCG